MSQKPSGCLQPLGKAKKGRHLRKTEQLWPLSSRLLVAERLRINTHRLRSVLVSNHVLSNVWWTIIPRESTKGRALIQKALCLWFNSSLGFTLMLAHREQTQGAWVKFKKPQLKSLPVPDFYTLGASRMKSLASAFDKLANSGLEPFPNLEKDKVRIQIDEAICNAFGLPDLATIRTLLANEPIVTLKPLYSNE